MAWRRIGEVTGGSRLAAMAKRAERSRRVAAAIEEELPEWLEASGLRYRFGPGTAVTIIAGRSKRLQLVRILPAIKDRLAEFGIERVAIETGGGGG